jgi:hypothetical protein
MKSVDTAIKDAQTVIPALKEAYSKLNLYYNEATHPKLRILDSLIAVCLASFVT